MQLFKHDGGEHTTSEPKRLNRYPPTAGVGTFVPASNNFGFRMLQALTGPPSAPANVFISPLSLSLALTMVMDGTVVRTHQQMQKALGYQAHDTRGAIESDAHTLLSQYEGSQISSDVDARIANALWSNRALPREQGHLSPDFAARTARVFGATVEAIDFSRASGARRVNAWTSEHTKGKIPTIVADGPLGTAALIVTNAVYFKAKWNKTFETVDTRPGTFKLASGRTKPVRLMTKTVNLPYLKGDGFGAVQIPYDDGRFSLCIVLPDKGVDIRSFQARRLASIAQWNAYLPKFADSKVALQLPRFKIAYTSDGLTQVLNGMGMTAPFTASNDFLPMGYVRAAISDVLHKTTLVVDESGSEATAVTGETTILFAMVRKENPIIPFVVDHPFFCSIRDNATGALIFLGRITDPDTD